MRGPQLICSCSLSRSSMKLVSDCFCLMCETERICVISIQNHVCCVHDFAWLSENYTSEKLSDAVPVWRGPGGPALINCGERILNRFFPNRISPWWQQLAPVLIELSHWDQVTLGHVYTSPLPDLISNSFWRLHKMRGKLACQLLWPTGYVSLL